VALWWLYFGQVATGAVRRMAGAEVPGQVGRDAYTYLHLPIVAGVLLSAVGDELVLAHPTDELGTAGALVTLGGPALYLVGLAAFGRRIGRRSSAAGLVAAAVLLAAVPLAARADGLVVAVGVTAVLVLLAAVEGGLRRGHGHRSMRRVQGT
jgi:low temperature requirement protein LtrA